MTTFTVASTDYFAICGASSTTTVKAPSTIPAGYFYVYPNGPFKHGPFRRVRAAEHDPHCTHNLPRSPTGLSHTVMISEMSGRPWLYLADGRQVPVANFPSYVSASSEDVTDDMPLDYGWGAWAHNNNFSVGTWSSDGTMQGGPNAINCSNYRGVFSFHSAGAYGGFADGSVRLLASEMSPVVLFRPGHGTCRRRYSGGIQHVLSALCRPESFMLSTVKNDRICPGGLGWRHSNALYNESLFEVHLADAGGGLTLGLTACHRGDSKRGVSRKRRGFLQRETGGGSQVTFVPGTTTTPRCRGLGPK